jgi:hypothetical protein
MPSELPVRLGILSTIIHVAREAGNTYKALTEFDV